MDDLFSLSAGAGTYAPAEMLLNMVLALVLGVVVAYVYRYTHKGLSYSQSFTLTLVFVAAIVAVVMMVIGSSLARAFAMVGALSIIRFRTVVKDTKDTAFVFAALAEGMAAGTSSYFLAVSSCVFISLIALVMYKTNFGSTYKSEFVLRFLFDQEADSGSYLEKINEFAKRSSVLHLEPSGDGRHLTLTFDIALKKGADTAAFATAIGKTDGVSDVTLIAAKQDVDY
ncbi:MAG: DUF4956 domain-containing protein [Gammaproteobacteria bacterium]|nr:DUF4956 domain-containing protein [Gammaproteobacteria bacterium]